MQPNGEIESELLAKLEEQNSALLNDTKAVPRLPVGCTSIGYRNSFSGDSFTDELNGFSSAPSHSEVKVEGSNSKKLSDYSIGSVTSTRLHEEWSTVISNWDQYSRKRSYVADLIRKGLPLKFRPMVWLLYTGAYDSSVKKLYSGYLEVASPAEKAIRRDIARTFPTHDLFKDENGYGQECLYRVMKAYSIHDREVGYCQGSGFVVGLLLMQLTETDAFAMFVQLMNDYRLREMYKPSMIEVGVYMYQLEHLLAEYLPVLNEHFTLHSFAPSVYASAWFLTLFTTVFPIPMATQVMDHFLINGINFIFRMSLAILKFSADQLLQADMESMVVFLQHEGPELWYQHSSTIFNMAFSFKLNTRKMKKLEKEYLTMRSQEREDQIELRRLRTENGLLLQRLARMDEECHAVAERLVQSQLIRAQESEIMLKLRCQVSILRRTALLNEPESTDHTGVPNEPSIEAPTVKDAATLHAATQSEDGVSSVDNESGDRMNYLLSTCNLQPNGGSPTLRLRPPSLRAMCRQYSLYPELLQKKSPSQTTVQPVGELESQADDSELINRSNQLLTDLSLSRHNEANARSELIDLQHRYHQLEELSKEQSLRLGEQVATLKSELFAVKLRETEALSHLDELRKRLEEVQLMLQNRLQQCKCGSLQSDATFGKRSSLKWLQRPHQNHKSATFLNTSFASSIADDVGLLRLSDSVAELRFTEEIAALRQQVTELTLQQEVAERRAERLDQQISELLKEKAAASERESHLCKELKAKVRQCADIESKRKADSLMWRSRDLAVRSQLTEHRQSLAEMEHNYQSLLTAQYLQTGGEPVFSGDFNDKSWNIDGIQEAELLTKSHSKTSRCDSSTPRRLSCDDQASEHVHPTQLWKDLPSSIMTESIGPLEDLCLLPDDPMITSIYTNQKGADFCGLHVQKC